MTATLRCAGCDAELPFKWIETGALILDKAAEHECPVEPFPDRLFTAGDEDTPPQQGGGY